MSETQTVISDSEESLMRQVTRVYLSIQDSSRRYP
jgi:hypothetical protein